MSEKIVVLCHGCFDVLHTGHIYHLKKAKEFGNHLVVSITHEAHAKKKLKFSAEFRQQMLNALDFVDEVIITEDRTAIAAIERVKPQFYVKGKEYENLELDQSGDIYLEKQTTEKFGGQLVFTSDDIIFSATKIKATSETFIDLSERGYRLPEILKFIKDVKDLKVCVIGETIIDRWTPVKTEGVSSKSSCQTALIEGAPENQLGGAYVIARHLKDFVKKVSIVTNDFRPWCQCDLEDGIEHLFYTKGAIIKERFYQPALNTKIFELKTDTLHQSYIEQHDFSEFDVILISDFGHGMLNKEAAAKLTQVEDCFLAVMAQTNSSNMGFNRVDKYKRADMYCLDKVELKLCLNHHEALNLPKDLNELEAFIQYKKLFITLGSQGAVLYEGNTFSTIPALVTKVIDPIGAGDAFFSLASLAAYLNYSPELSLLIPSLSSAMNTQWLCNEKSVTRSGLTETAKKVI